MVVCYRKNKIYHNHVITSYIKSRYITESGELVNMDCSGNRAAGMIFGPKKVIVIVGANKLVKDTEEAMIRIEKVAIMNAKRINNKTPCAETGQCDDCFVKDRLYNYISIVKNGAKFLDRFTVIVIGDEVGY